MNRRHFLTTTAAATFALLSDAADSAARLRDDREPLCGARNGATTVGMICAVFESHRLGGLRVPLPMKTRGNPFEML